MNLKACGEELIEAYRGNISLSFELGQYKRLAVKIVDDRGIKSLKIIEVEEKVS